MYGSVCPTVEEGGVKILHANRRAAHIDKFPPFRDTYMSLSKVILFTTKCLFLFSDLEIFVLCFGIFFIFKMFKFLAVAILLTNYI